MGQLKKLAGETAVYGLSSIVGRLLNYLLVPIYTRIFVPEEYGVVSEFYAYATFLMILYTYGMETAYFHFSRKTGDDKKVYANSLSAILASTSVISAILLLFSNNISSALGYPDNPEYIRWFAAILAFDALTAIPFARLRQQGKAKKFASLKLLNISINIVLNLFFLYYLPKASVQNSWAHSLYDPSVGVGYVFLSNLIASAVTLLFFIPDYGRSKLQGDKVLIKQMLVYSWPLLIAGFAGMINETLDRAVLKYLVTDKSSAMEQLGIYSACYKLSILMTLFVQTFRYAAEPFFFARHEKENSRELYATVMNYFVLTCSFIFLGVMLYIDVIKYFIGQAYHSGLHIVPVLLFANLCLGVYLNLSIWYKLTGQTRFGAWLAIFGATVTIAFNFWLIPKMGYTGAAWATLICYASMMIFSYLKGRDIFPVPYDLRKLFLIAGSAVAFWWGTDVVIRAFNISEWKGYVLNAFVLVIWVIMMLRILKMENAGKS